LGDFNGKKKEKEKKKKRKKKRKRSLRVNTPCGLPESSGTFGECFQKRR
jgi:hypothetical protein